MPTKAPTGITGFDEITGGGLPRGRTTLLVGGPGSGTTVLALQFLVHGARDCKEPLDAQPTPDLAAKRREIYRLHEWLLARELTGLITAKAGGDETSSIGQRPFAFMPYMMDCVVIAAARTPGHPPAKVTNERVSK